MIQDKPDREAVIRQLRLEPHPEGGYYRRSFQADHRDTIDQGLGKRFTMTSIFYLLTVDSPGFDFADMTLGLREDLLAQFPQHTDLITAYTPLPGKT